MLYSTVYRSEYSGDVHCSLAQCRVDEVKEEMGTSYVHQTLIEAISLFFSHFLGRLHEQYCFIMFRTLLYHTTAILICYLIAKRVLIYDIFQPGKFSGVKKVKQLNAAGSGNFDH